MIWKYYCAPQWKMPHRYEHTIHPAGPFGELIGDIEFCLDRQLRGRICGRLKLPC